MSEKAHRNGAGSGDWPLLPTDPHEAFLELCALSATSELSREESERLRLHLSICAMCRQAQHEYELLVAEAIPGLAADAYVQRIDDESPSSWSMERAEADLMKSISNEPGPILSKPRPSLPVYREIFRVPISIAAGLLIIFTLGGYEVGVHRHRRPEPVVAKRTTSAAIPPGHPPDLPTSPDGAMSGGGRRGAATQGISPGASQHELAALKREQDNLEAELAQRISDLDRSAAERAEIDRKLAQAETEVQDLRRELSSAPDLKPQDVAQLELLTERADDLGAAVRQKEKVIADQQDLLQHDRDIRNLIGARDLYIAEIYDVAKSGATQKPFGRVFYTKDKSLVFYGYDLDQQGGVKAVNTFQAWGRQGAGDRHDVSLGILYQDDANNKRWVLKSNDARTLASLDAVFVTVEPKGGSLKPTGKPILFTYLRLDPNHP